MDSSRYDEKEIDHYGDPIHSRHDETEEYMPKYHHFDPRAVPTGDIDQKVEDKAKEIEHSEQKNIRHHHHIEK